jgi:hypothetical protein
MAYNLLFIAFVVWYALSLIISEKIGKKKDIGEEWSFFISMMFSPLIGYLVSKYYRSNS